MKNSEDKISTYVVLKSVEECWENNLEVFNNFLSPQEIIALRVPLYADLIPLAVGREINKGFLAFGSSTEYAFLTRAGKEELERLEDEK